mmetsp:Transcript_28043/g.41419  ORF Transcript_28043/g.41419 Transcript_28043/m.41419 type:complete len:95 (+) Transcript_28043:198-482(+)
MVFFKKETRTAADEELQALTDSPKGRKKSLSQETHLRSALKGLTWRVVATTTTMTIAYTLTGEVKLAMEIGFIEFLAKLAIYYVHERIWASCRV